MKKSNWTIAALLAVTLAGITLGSVGCTQKEPGQNQGQGAAKAVKYTCPMHPDIVSDHPGKCPKCGMDLVEK